MWRFLRTLDDIARDLEHPLIVVLLTMLIAMVASAAAVYFELAWQAWRAYL